MNTAKEPSTVRSRTLDPATKASKNTTLTDTVDSTAIVLGRWNTSSGSGGGANGKATAFSVGRPGLYSGMDLGFFSSESILAGCGVFSYNVESFLFPIIIYLCEIYQL